jgi:hypothetical protein
MPRRLALAAAALVLGGAPARGQHVHTPGMRHPTGDAPALAAGTQAGQGAFAAIAEVVRLLEADPATDWSRVDLERLRQHLIDMDDVVLRSTVRRTDVPGGARFVVTGRGRTVGAIQRMTRAHLAMLGSEGPYRGTVVARADGAVLTITAAAPADSAIATRIRGLGFVGLLTVGDHHARHHLLLARGGLEGHGH